MQLGYTHSITWLSVAFGIYDNSHTAAENKLSLAEVGLPACRPTSGGGGKRLM